MIGNFVLTLTTSGNLIGEFTNELTTKVFTESADRTNGKIQKYFGEFLSTWQEDEIAIITRLIISPIHGSNELKYELKWSNLNGNLIFEGEGFIFNNYLTGFYRIVSE